MNNTKCSMFGCKNESIHDVEVLRHVERIFRVLWHSISVEDYRIICHVCAYEKIHLVKNFLTEIMEKVYKDHETMLCAPRLSDAIDPLDSENNTIKDNLSKKQLLDVVGSAFPGLWGYINTHVEEK